MLMIIRKDKEHMPQVFSLFLGVIHYCDSHKVLLKHIENNILQTIVQNESPSLYLATRGITKRAINQYFDILPRIPDNAR